MTPSPTSKLGIDLGQADETGLTMFVPHPGHMGCGYTLLLDEQIPLFCLGIMPVRCKSCHELITDVEGA